MEGAEELTIVFDLGGERNIREHWREPNTKVWNTVPAISDEEIIDLINIIAGRLGISISGVRRAGSLRKMKELRCDGLSISFSHIAHNSISILVVEEVDRGASKDWPAWVNTIATHPRFIQAWVVNARFQLRNL